MIDTIIKIAEDKHWKLFEHQENIKMLSFVKIGVRINVYYSKMTVATCINHPQKGKTQLFRRRVSINELKKIFINPRVHTDMGYYQK